MAFYGCAKQLSPQGGPKDVEIPQVISTTPPSGSKNFAENAFEIRFDEFVELNNINDNLIVSPQFSKAPEVKLKGKKIKIILPEEPKENTTYSFTFLDAIQDITEKNSMQSLVYAFSTGNTIDSLRVSGRVEDAFTTEPVTETFVLLYNTKSDSIFTENLPSYITKTNAKGDFAFFYLAEGTYRIYALKDENSSFTFDTNTESIAFFDDVIIPSAEVYQDSTDTVAQIRYLPNDIELRIFTPRQVNQFVVSKKREDYSIINLDFALKYDTSLKWESPDFGLNECIETFSENRDSLKIQILDADIARKDSIHLHFTYNTGIDTIGVVTDTMVFKLPKEIDSTLKLTDNLKSGKLNYGHDVTFESKSVLKNILRDSIVLYQVVNDSTEEVMDVEWKENSPSSFTLKANWKEEEKYRLYIPEASISDVFDRVVDSTSIDIRYRAKSEYSELQVNLKGIGDAYVFAELMKGDELIEKGIPNGEKQLNFDFLEPGKYQLRLIKDGDNDGMWDTGDLELEIQPEIVHYYVGDIEIRASWKQEIDWVLSTDLGSEKLDEFLDFED